MKRKATCPLAFAAGAVAAVFVMSTPLRASETDDRIASSFTKTYVYKTYLKDDAVRIEVKDGVVTLTGTVTEESHKLLAQEAVANLPGVTRVDNQLATKAERGSESADTWIGLKIRTTLLFHRNVSASSTAVDVKDGIVILKGEASSEAQKELTTEYVSDIEGVKEVKNEMTVRNAPVEPSGKTVGEKVDEMGKKVGETVKDVGRKVGEKMEDAGESIDDASITAEVKTALWIHRSTRTVHIKVKTQDGEVTLTGLAKNESEKSMVTKLVTDIRGVTGVRNQMTVKNDQSE